MKFYINKILLVLFILDTHDLFFPISSGFYTGLPLEWRFKGHRDDGLHTNPYPMILRFFRK